MEYSGSLHSSTALLRAGAPGFAAWDGYNFHTQNHPLLDQVYQDNPHSRGLDRYLELPKGCDLHQVSGQFLDNDEDTQYVNN